MLCFSKKDIATLQTLLEVSEHIKIIISVKVSKLEVLCILLCCLAYPSRLKDLKPMFGRFHTYISYISNHVLNLIYERFVHLVGWDSAHLTTAKLDEYAAAIHAKGAPLNCVVGFFDETLRGISYPTENQ